MRTLYGALTSGFLALFLLPATTLAITSSQTDTFQDGTTANWTDGQGGSNVANIAAGGPAGAADRYLQVSSGTFGGGPRLLTFNRTQWIGDFPTAGVGGLSIDLKNFGTAALPIRIAIRQATGGSTTPGYSSTTAFSLPADGAWHHAIFSLDVANLTAINSPQPLATDLAAVAEFRILGSSAPALVGDSLDAQIGMDNLTALVPEPATTALLAVIALAGIPRRRLAPQ